jgi:hypothetical protein
VEKKYRRKLSAFRPKHVFDKRMLSILFAGAGFFVTLIYSCHFLPFRASESTLPETLECLGMSTFFRGITKPIPSLFRGVFSEQNSVANPISQHLSRGGQANLIKIPQITNWQILMIIPLLQISKCLRCASPQIANPQIFMLNRQIANPQISAKYCTTLLTVVFLKPFF